MSNPTANDEETKPAGADPSGQQPMFYQRPEALLASQHGALRLRREADFDFARHTNSVPVTGSEFAQVMRFYPIVFGGSTPFPVAVLGLEETNLFVEPDASWTKRYYIPAYLRRYPFVFIAHPDGKQFLLGVDRACKRLVEDTQDTSPLFEDGKPSGLTQDAMRFCGAFQSDHRSTVAFTKALEEQNLLVDNQARAQLPNGRVFNLQGFKIVDRAAFANLSDMVIADWHKKGWLPLVHFHLASLDRFQDLIAHSSADAKPDAANISS